MSQIIATHSQSHNLLLTTQAQKESI